MGMSTDESNTVNIVGLVFGLLSLVCSFLTLLLIYYTRKWNGYLLLLTSMTFSQIVYDVNYIMRPIPGVAACYFVQFCDLVGGLGVSFWTNILAFVITYTVVFSMSINIFALYKYFSLFGYLLPISIGVLAVATPKVIVHTDDGLFGGCYYHRTAQGDFVYDFYYYGRLASVFITIFLCSLTFSKLRQMAITTGQTVSKDTGDSGNESRAILRTVKKMNFYAVAQVICRSGAAWNEFYYGEYSTYESSMMAAICSPSSGILNFFIFLFMQPNAWKNFKYLICCKMPPRPRGSSAVDGERGSFLGNNSNNNNLFSRDKFISQADYDHHYIVNNIKNAFSPGSMHAFIYGSNSLHSEPRDSSFIEFTPSFESKMGGNNGNLSRKPTNTGVAGFFSRKNTEQSGPSVRSVPSNGPLTRTNSNIPRTLTQTGANGNGQETENPIYAKSNTQSTVPPSIVPPVEDPNRAEADSVSSAYDFFDEDYRQVGGAYSNSFYQRRSTWGVKESLSSEVSRDELPSYQSTVNTSITRQTGPDVESAEQSESNATKS